MNVTFHFWSYFGGSTLIWHLPNFFSKSQLESKITSLWWGHHHQKKRFFIGMRSHLFFLSSHHSQRFINFSEWLSICLYSTGKSDRADQLGGTTTNNFAKKNFFAKSYFSIVIINILKDENDSSKGKKVYLVSTTKLRFIRVPPK